MESNPQIPALKSEEFSRGEIRLNDSAWRACAYGLPRRMNRVPYFLLFLTFSFALAESEDRVDFNRDIRPIFTKNCTACHGGVKEAGKISFIYREKALRQGKSGEFAIVPGKPAESEVIRRMRSTDPDEVMPKPKHGPPLPEAEIKIIERWIAEGAEWKNHWSFELPKEVAVGKISDEKWPSMPLDRHVIRRLDLEKMSPSPEAAPEEWLRRASFDLTGLPPSFEELTDFKNAVAKDPVVARQAAVDRLLESPRFGERWAAVWLDLARYSDTYGLEKDSHRDVWPFRDWVIRALNAGMPYDQFTIEQLAGDLLPNATAEQRLATAFHRNTLNNPEAGTDDEEFRLTAVLDRVSTTWTAWQATTFACVQCHSHPYDPIEHEEFYKFTAFFNNTIDHDQDSDAPHMKVAESPEFSVRSSELEIKVSTLREQLHAGGREVAKQAQDWVKFAPDQLKSPHGKLEIAADGAIRASGTFPVKTTHQLFGPAPAFSAVRFSILPENDDPKKWPERGSFLSQLQLNLIGTDGKAKAIKLKEVFADRAGDLLEAAADGNVGAFPKLEGPRWWVFVTAEPVTPQPGERLEILLHQRNQASGIQAVPLRRFTLEISNSAEWMKLVNDPKRLEIWKAHDESKAELKEIPGAMVPVMVERPARETRLFARGNFLSKEQVVTAGVPQLLKNSDAKDEGMNRLDMARWMVNSQNPLTARVITNRLWGELFGIGIVETAEDFGTSGTLPSHLELLDHLALRFTHEHKWSIKSALREMVLSSTYRQTHRASKALVEKDPRNRLLGRGPRNRLSAEMIRDQALHVSGLISPKMYGPPVYPPQPQGIWRSNYNAQNWKESKGEDRYRRGIYTYSKRTSGFPGLLTFDAPSRNVCTARRITSNTPLQALVTMNDPAHIEAAQAFAKRMMTQASKIEDQLAHGYLLATQQSATPDVIQELTALHADCTAQYRENPGESAKLGSSPEIAALVLTANTILNLDSALTR